MAALATEDTLGLIKPNAFEKREEIMKLIKTKGFTIVESAELQLTKERAEAFYAEHDGKGFFAELVEFMTSGKIVAMRLRKEGAIAGWRELIGPTNIEVAKKEAPESIRAVYGEDMTKNAAHGSDSTTSAARELDFFFSKSEDTLGLIKPNAFEKREEIMKLIKTKGFTIVESAELQLTKERAEAFYAEHAGKGFFAELVEFMTSGKIVAMRLRKDGAIAGWRELIGPTNIEVAKKEAPESIRAVYGEDMTKNAAHGSDSTTSAARELEFFFPKAEK
jgi:nucleoside diphosphate kinase